VNLEVRNFLFIFIFFQECRDGGFKKERFQGWDGV
jgi:hypothetical protein